jgi:hypothetical protein
VEGRCVPAGIEPDGCAAGFVHDGDRGCTPVLPPLPCARGGLTVIGDERCHDIMECGSGTWGDIPVEADTQFVDASFAGQSDGSMAAPWTTVTEAVDAAEPGAIVAVAAGSYHEEVIIIGKSVRLYGRCPSMVEIVIPKDDYLAVGIYEGADGSSVRGLALTADPDNASNVGLSVQGAADVVVERTWIHDAQIGMFVHVDGADVLLRDSVVEDLSTVGVAQWGGKVTVERAVVRWATASGIATLWGDGAAQPELSVTRSVIDDNAGAGVGCYSSSCEVHESVIRRTDTTNALEQDGQNGAALVASPLEDDSDSGFGPVSEATVSHCYVAGNQSAGIVGVGGVLEVNDTVVRDTREWEHGDPSLTRAGHGVNVTHVPPPDGRAAVFTIRDSVVASNIAQGINIGGAQATIEGVVVRDTLPAQTGANAGLLGSGLRIQSSDGELEQPDVTVAGSIFERNHSAGISTLDAKVAIDGCIVRDTREDAQTVGYGIQSSATSRHHLAPIAVTNSWITENRPVGIILQGVDAELRSLLVEGTSENSLGDGAGIMIQHTPGELLEAQAYLEGVRVVDSEDVGVAVFSSSADVVGTVIEDTKDNSSGHFGDAIQAGPGLLPTSVTLHSVRTEGSARAAISSFGAFVSFSAVELLCQSFDLDGEAAQDASFEFESGSFVSCGCPGSERTCDVVSAGLLGVSPI